MSAKASRSSARPVPPLPADAEAHAQLGRWLSRLHRTDESVDAARRALSLLPGSAATLDTIGVVFSRAGRHEQAVDCFARAVALDPGRAGLHFNHAASLKFLGRFAEAEAAYEACVRCDPRFWRAHSALAATRRQTPERNHLDRLERLLATGPLDPDAELHLRHALAKELEDLGRDDEAFAHLLAGNARKHAATGYRFERDQGLFEAVMRLFPDVMPAPAHADLRATRSPAHRSSSWACRAPARRSSSGSSRAIRRWPPQASRRTSACC